MEKSEQINELAAALAKTQAEIKPAVKDAKNEHFGNSYADLASVWDACREPLAKHGLSVVQLPATDGNTVSVVTVLMHTSGQWISSKVSTQIARTDPQPVGSAITYLRRYGLSAMVGIAPEDDDGERASAAAGMPAQRQQRQQGDRPQRQQQAPAQDGAPRPSLEHALKQIDDTRTKEDVEKTRVALRALKWNTPEGKTIAGAIAAKIALLDGKPCEDCGHRNGKHKDPNCPGRDRAKLPEDEAPEPGSNG